jgi:hypothetical protein
MIKVLTILLPALTLFTGPLLSAENIVLRTQPDASAPAITRMIATEKVLLEAAPASENSDWKKLDLKIPFEGYVPAASLTKSLAVIQNTPVHFLPDAASDTLTSVRDGDVYEVKRVKDDWATIEIHKEITTYFQVAATPEKASSATTTLIPAAPLPLVKPEPPVLTLSPAEPMTAPETTSPAFDPNLSVGITAPDQLPPENVIWSKATTMPGPARRNPVPTTPVVSPAPPVEPIMPPASNIMVSTSNTQARETTKKAPPSADQPHRLLTGTLVREIETRGTTYPLRLKSPDGRLIAYVDMSGIFISDLSAYLDQRVVLRGQLSKVKPGSHDLIIYVHQILSGN